MAHPYSFSWHLAGDLWSELDFYLRSNRAGLPEVNAAAAAATAAATVTAKAKASASARASIRARAGVSILFEEHAAVDGAVAPVTSRPRSQSWPKSTAVRGLYGQCS